MLKSAVTKRPSARFAPPPRPIEPVAPLESRLAKVAEILPARTRRPSARFAVSAMLTLAACANDTAFEMPVVPESSCAAEFFDHLADQPLNFPIEVRIDATTLSSQQLTAVREAAAFWNETMNADVFEAHAAAPNPDSADDCGVAWVTLGYLPKYMGYTRNTECRATVQISDQPNKFKDPNALKYTARHELGHVLGLDDDASDDTNLMNPRFVPQGTGEPNEHALCWVSTALTINDGDTTRMEQYR